MVRVAGNNCVLDGGEGQKSPPLPFIEVDEATARSLVGTGVAVLVGDDIARAIEWVESEEAAREASQEALAASDETETSSEVEGGESVAAEPAAEGAEPETEVVAPEAETSSEVEVGEPNSDRRQTIADALDLLEPEHFVKTGERKGRPKLNAVEDISGIRDLTVAEIDAVFAAKAAE